MLYVTLGVKKEAISAVSSYFDACYENDWLNTEFAKSVIKGIDNSEHVKDSCIESPVLGGISPRDLSSGCKGVILLANMPELLLCGERFGDNCFEWIFRLASKQDIRITLSHYLHLDYDFELTITNSNHVVRNCEELFSEIQSCTDKGLIMYDFD